MGSREILLAIAENWLLFAELNKFVECGVIDKFSVFVGYTTMVR